MLKIKDFPVTKLPKELKQGFVKDEEAVTVTIQKSDGSLPEMTDDEFEKKFVKPNDSLSTTKLSVALLSAIVGGFIACIYFVTNIIQSIRISEGFPLMESLILELITAGIFFALLLLPAIAILLKPPQSQRLQLATLLYPVIMILGGINMYLSTDPLAAGLPMVLIGIPAFIVLSIIILSQKR